MAGEQPRRDEEPEPFREATGDPGLPFSLAAHPELDTWIRVDPAETVTVFTGKVELGQGLTSTVARIAAEELDLDIARVKVSTADTDHGLDEGHTAGSMSTQQSGAAVRQAAAEARAHLVGLAARQLGVAADALSVDDGTVHDPTWSQRVTYWELHGGRRFAHRATGEPAPKKAAEHRIVGLPTARRVDLAGLVTGATRFVNDLRPAGLLFARLVRPPGPGARLASLDQAPARDQPGVVTVVRDGSFLAVVAEHEAQAVRAAEVLARHATWSDGPPLPARTPVSAWLRDQPAEAYAVLDGAPAGPPQEPSPPPAWTHRATYSRPYLLHASIGPSAAVARWEGDQLAVWSTSQSVYVLRTSLATAFAVDPATVHVHHVPGAGSYGHNGADDAAFDAAVVARSVPGRPVLLQWSRTDEHCWEPFGAPGRVELAAATDAEGAITAWRHDAWGTTHLNRPSGGAPRFVSGPLLDPPLTATPPTAARGKEVGLHRNATPLYDLPRQSVTGHVVAAAPLRTSSLRSLGAHLNVFAIESFLDELAHRHGRSPLELRLGHLRDERARAVLLAACERAGWDGERSTDLGRGRGVGVARYKNASGYAAVLAEVHVDDASVRLCVDHLTIAADCGEVVDPKGLANQLEGGAIQATSWTLCEQVRFDERCVTSVDWDSYPILRFGEVPTVDAVLIDRPGFPFLGAGEIVAGPTAAAIANAAFDATGLRLRDLPLGGARFRDALLNAPAR